MRVITILVEDEEEQATLIAVLQEAEEECVIDFPFGCITRQATDREERDGVSNL